MSEFDANEVPPSLPVEPAENDVAPLPPRWPFMGYGEATGIAVSFLVIQVILAIAVVIVLMIVFAALGGVDEALEAFQHPTVLGMINILACIPLLLWGWWRSRSPLDEALGMKPFAFASILAIIPLSAGSHILLSEFDNLMRHVTVLPNFASDAFAQFALAPIASFFLLVIVAPLTEEFVFRGVIYRALRKRKSVRAAMIVSALLFSIIHLNPVQLAPAFFLGLLLAYVYERTQSVWPCMFLHAFANFTSYSAMTWIAIEIEGFTGHSTEPTFQPLWFDALGLALFAVGAWSFYLITRRPNSTNTANTQDAAT